MPRAAIVTEFGQPITVEEVTLLPLGPNDVRIEVLAAGICQSDLTLISGNYGPIFEAPIVPGHECAGRVLEVGAAVSRVRPGDRVIAAMVPVCGTCFHCVRGETYLCEMHAVVCGPDRKRVTSSTGPAISMTGVGAWADEMVMDEISLVPVKSTLDDAQLALIGCGIATGVGAALHTAGVTPGSSVAVVACGGVGLSAIQGAQIAGAAQIFAVDPSEAKRKTAMSLGATHAIDPADGDVVEQVRAATEGRGADFSFEVLGRAETIMQARKMTRVGGVTVIVGATPVGTTVELDAFDLHREGSIRGCGYGSCQVMHDFPRLIKLAESGRLNLGAMVSMEVGLADINKGVEALRSGEVVRCMVIPALDKK